VKKSHIEMVRLDVNDVVAETIALVQRELNEPPGVVANGVSDRPRELDIRLRQDEAGQAPISVTGLRRRISAKNAEHLFDPFFHHRISCMGMGLSICRWIMEAHGGRLWATANPPHGTQFQFTPPMNVVS
jgi:K+-sensing histidine kinase KdpD